MKSTLRALVLAAGEGQRLRPLTLVQPKPLLPVAGQPLLSHSLARLEEYGCEAAAVNLHHLGDQIRERLGESWGELPLTYSEEETLLGTLGAVGPLHEFLIQADQVMIVNGDSLCRWPVKTMVRAHQKAQQQEGAVATLLFAEKARPERFFGGVGLGDGPKGERVVTFDPPPEWESPEAPAEDLLGVDRRRVFAGAHIFSAELLVRPEVAKLFDDSPPGTPFDFVRDLYRPLLEAGETLRAVTTSRDWHDLGTPRRYLDGVLDWSRGRLPARILGRRSWIAEGADVSEEADVDASVIEEGARVAAGARIKDSLLLPGAQVPSGAEVRDAILGFGVELDAGTYVERRMVNSQSGGFAAGPGDSLLGDLVYTPLRRRRRAPEDLDHEQKAQEAPDSSSEDATPQESTPEP